MRWCAGLILLWPLMAGADVWDHGFKALLDAANAPPIGVEAGAARLEALEARMAEADPRVRLSLEALIDAQRRLKARAARAEEAAPAAVLIGAAHYSGAATPEALEMELELRVTLRREGAWKAAPLIGDDVALRAAQVDGQDLPLYVERGYYIWPTQRVGE
ncbi:hypothetical protein KKB55_06975, partial [Myxococcota bacterium]|nr:hypothetical protein [Myxococcota bacterium]